MITAKNIYLALTFFLTVGVILLTTFGSLDIWNRIQYAYMVFWMVIGFRYVIFEYIKQPSYAQNWIFDYMWFYVCAGCFIMIGDAIYVAWQYLSNYDVPVSEIGAKLASTSMHENWCFNILLLLLTALFVFLKYVIEKNKDKYIY